MAIGIVAIVASTAGLVVHTMSVGQAALARASRGHDHEMNAWRLLRGLAARAELRATGEDRFDGTESTVEMPTWCTSAGGWLERCRLGLVLGADSAGSRVRMTAGEHMDAVIHLEAGDVPAAFRFLQVSDGELDWVSRWSSTSTLPRAVAVLVGRDTLVLRIGERG